MLNLRQISELFGLRSRTRSLRDAFISAGLLPRSTSQALSPEALYRLAEHHSKLPANEILMHIASEFGLPACHAVAPPALDLLDTFRIGTPVELAERGILVQRSRDEVRIPYVLVVSDPGELEIDEFLRAGVDLQVALPSDIRSRWEQIMECELRTTAVANVEALSALLRVVRLHGGREIFLGHPDENHYEFFSNGKRFVGTLHPDLFATTLSAALSAPGGIITDGPAGETLRIGVTSNGVRPVIVAFSEFEDEERHEIPPAPQVVAPLQRTILFIEDDHVFAPLLTRVLRERGWSVIHTASTIEAERLLYQEGIVPSLIVCDLHLPERGGHFFLRQLRRKGKPCPILVLTGEDDQGVEAEMILLGADSYVRKAADPRVLLAWCHNLASRTAAAQQEQAA